MLLYIGKYYWHISVSVCFFSFVNFEFINIRLLQCKPRVVRSSFSFVLLLRFMILKVIDGFLLCGKKPSLFVKGVCHSELFS